MKCFTDKEFKDIMALLKYANDLAENTYKRGLLMLERERLLGL